MNTPAIRPPSMSSEADLDTATAAMRHWTAGAADGDWSRLVAMLDPDITFHVPVSGFSGVQHGVAAASRFFDHLAAVLRADLVVTSTLRDGARVGFEVSVHGSMLGQRFVQALCLVFLVGDGRVRAFHEYLAWPGGLDPETAPGPGPESHQRHPLPNDVTGATP